MPTGRQGSIRLFQFKGIHVFLHWSWFVWALYVVQGGGVGKYSSRPWRVMEYLSLFVIVLLHEFGHSLACRQVGGQANQIVLWPLGGVAYVSPPPRAGATLWSIAAGPLVNVVLAPVLYGLLVMSRAFGLAHTHHNVYAWIGAALTIDVFLFVFNMLPIYPLDGGQILRSLLWFALGRGRSLLLATVVGFIGAIGLIAFAIWRQDAWLGVITGFMVLNCWGGLQHARQLLRMAKLPRRDGFACPACRNAPPVGELWKCSNCGQPFDIFENHGACPYCSAQYPILRCLDCGEARSMPEWVTPAAKKTFLRGRP